MTVHIAVTIFTVLLATSTSYPLAALTALLGGNGLNANFNANPNNNVNGNLNLQQQQQQQQQTQGVPVQTVESTQPGNSCPCTRPQTEIFVTETPEGSEIIAAETTNDRGVSLATANDYVPSETEDTREPQVQRTYQPPVVQTVQQPSTILPQTQAPVQVAYPSRSYAGSLAGAVSGSGHLGHALSASGSLAANLGYAGSLSGAGSGIGHGHAGSMSGSMAGPHGSMAGSLAGSHGLHGGSMAGSLAGSIAGSNRHVVDEVSPNENSRSIQTPAVGDVNENGAIAGGHGVVEPNHDATRNDVGSDSGISENVAGGASGSDSDGAGAGIVPGDVTGGRNLRDNGAMAGSVAGVHRQNGGGALAGSIASASGNGHAHAASMAGAHGNGPNGSSAMSGSLAGSHNGVARAVSGAMSGYQHHGRAVQPQREQPIEATRRNFNGNQNINSNVNNNRNQNA